MSVAELLFELASDDRLTILSEIEKKPLRLSEVARKLNTTVQETSRQLERLAEARLVSRNSESKYEMTPLGRIAFSLLPSFEFLQGEKEFFLSHDISGLPAPFINRMGELSEHRTINKLDEAIAHTEQVIKGAEKYVWLMADQSMRQSYPHEHPVGVDFRLIFPKDIDSETIQRVRSRIGASLQIARVGAVKISIAMNEKTAAIYFPSLDGRMDFTRGFAGEKPVFHEWCNDLYGFYWGRAREGYSI